MGAKIASVGLIALVAVFVVWALIGGRQGFQPPVTVEPPPFPREEQPIAEKLEPAPEEKLAYAPEGALIVPAPVEPSQAAPVPSVTDSVPPPPPAEQQAEEKQDPAATLAPPPADKPPTPPAQAEAPKVETPEPTVTNEPPATEEKKAEDQTPEPAFEEGIVKVADDEPEVNFSILADRSGSSDESDVNYSILADRTESVSEGDADYSILAGRSESFDGSGVNYSILADRSSESYEEPYNILNEVVKRKGEYSYDYEGDNPYCSPSMRRYLRHHRQRKRVRKQYGGFHAFVGIPPYISTGYPRGISIGYGPARVPQHHHRGHGHW